MGFVWIMREINVLMPFYTEYDFVESFLHFYLCGVLRTIVEQFLVWNLNETTGCHLGRRLDGHVRHGLLSALVFLLKD